MRQCLRWISVLSLVCLGCGSASAPIPTPPGNFDPVLQILPLVGAYQYEHGQKFDVGIALSRTQLTDGTQVTNDLPDGRMCFQLNGYPAQVDAAIVNGVALPWFPDGATSSSDTYEKRDSSMYGNPDTMNFSYRNFAGESFTSNVRIAPSFGRITCPDTVSVALGCTIRYERSVPGDSVWFSLQNIDPNGNVDGIGGTIPDTGALVIAPHQLTYLPNGILNLYSVDIHRIHWEAVTSPRGKRIGIYSYQGAGNFGFAVKP